MKVIFIIPMAILLAGCMRYDYLVEHDYSYKGDFKKYSSFYFMNNPSLVEDSTFSRILLEDAIKFQMEVLGYKMIEKKPNLLVSYTIYYDDFKFKGYLQPELEEWIDRDDIDEDEYDPVKYELMEGTLLIQLIDKKKNSIVWQGYSSGVFANQYASNKRFIKRSVQSIFNQYRVLAEGFIVESKAY